MSHLHLTEESHLHVTEESQLETEVARLERSRKALAPPDDSKLAAQYKRSLERLFSLTRFGERMDLSTPYTLNQTLGDPLSSYQNILIGGTNGKGSTCAQLTALARSAKIRTGRFTSPHLISFRERITIDEVPISYHAMIEGVEVIFQAAQRAQVTMSFFEATWALATWYFAKENLSWVIWEVGLGGRLDATNVCDPVISAITQIGLDHTHILGTTLEQIASEKVAIFREGRPALTGERGERLDLLRKVSPYPICSAPPLPKEVAPSLHGVQRQNASLAWEISQRLHWMSSVEVLNHFRWPGRLEELKGFWLDCAHNPSAAASLLPWLKDQRSRHPTRPVHMIFGASQDKDIKGFLKKLSPWVDHIIWVTPQYPRCVSGASLKACYEELCQEKYTQRRSKELTHAHKEQGSTFIKEVSSALERRSTEALTLVTGSCFLVGEVRAYLLELPFPEADLITRAR